MNATYTASAVYLEDLERSHGLDSAEFKAALQARGLVVLDKPAKKDYCWCLVPTGHPFAGHTGICCSVHGDCDMPGCYCDCTGEPDPWEDSIVFADPGGRSALRAQNAPNGRCPSHGCHMVVKPDWSYCPTCAAHLNPRKHACPTCGEPGVLTDDDVQARYCCDVCADRAEGIYRGADY